MYKLIETVIAATIRVFAFPDTEIVELLATVLNVFTAFFNFLCMVLSLNFFDNWYSCICGCIHVKWFSFWSKMAQDKCSFIINEESSRDYCCNIM